MCRLLLVLLTLSLSAAAQEMKIAVIGLLHSHVWGHLPKMIQGEPGNRKVVELCAPRKIHVIFEKPLAAALADSHAIRQLVERHKIKPMTNYQMAWWPSQYTAKERSEAGDIGKPWRLRGIAGHGGPGSKGPRSQYFFEWLTDPVKNGAGAPMDFGCYNALWSLWYPGRPETVFAHVNHLRPETFPKVEDNATLILSYQNGAGLLEGSWDPPRGFQELEIFGLGGSLLMAGDKVELRLGRGEAKAVPLTPLVPECSEPIAYMVHCIRTGKPVDGLTALDINVGVAEIIDAALQSVKTGRAVRLGAKR